jgi:hypothetical protein
MFMVAYVVLFGLHVVLWGARDSLQSHNRRVRFFFGTCDQTLNVTCHALAPCGCLFGSPSSVRETHIHAPGFLFFIY